MKRYRPSDLTMMRIALVDARARIAETGGDARDRAIVARLTSLPMPAKQRAFMDQP